MTRAARKLFMTQPSVSQMVAELENNYNTACSSAKPPPFLTDTAEGCNRMRRHIINLEAQAKRNWPI
jgi:DNA-binding transcriptional LysR family regulator